MVVIHAQIPCELWKHSIVLHTAIACCAHRVHTNARNVCGRATVRKAFMESCGFCALCLRARFFHHLIFICTKTKTPSILLSMAVIKLNAIDTHSVELVALTYLTDFIVANLSARNWIRNGLDEKVSIPRVVIITLCDFIWLSFSCAVRFAWNIHHRLHTHRFPFEPLQLAISSVFVQMKWHSWASMVLDFTFWFHFQETACMLYVN